MTLKTKQHQSYQFKLKRGDDLFHVFSIMYEILLSSTRIYAAMF